MAASYTLRPMACNGHLAGTPGCRWTIDGQGMASRRHVGSNAGSMHGLRAGRQWRALKVLPTLNIDEIDTSLMLELDRYVSKKSEQHQSTSHALTSLRRSNTDLIVALLLNQENAGCFSTFHSHPDMIAQQLAQQRR